MSSPSDPPREPEDRPGSGPGSGGSAGSESSGARGGAVPPWTPAGGSPSVPGPRDPDWAPPGPDPVYGARPVGGPDAGYGPIDPGLGGFGGSPFGPGGAPKPGVVPLRPLALGELLDGAVSYIRAHPRVVLGAAAVVAVASQLIRVLLEYMLGSVVVLSAREAGLPPGTLPDITLGDYAGAIVTQLATVVLSGLLIVVVSRAILGAPVDGGQAWLAARPRVPGLIGIAVLTAVLVGLAAFVGMLPGILVLAAGGESAGGLAAGGLALVVGLLAGLAAAIWVITVLALATPAYVLETTGLVEALRRSWALVRPRFWPVLGIVVLTGLIGSVVTGVLEVLFELLARLATGASLTAAIPATGLVGTVIAAIGSVLALTIVAPFQAGVTGLLYVDQRMRREGFDIELQRAAAFGS